jgi:uncharacterized pyridoxamine 5'-phosphate oxidase family protein
MKITDEVFKNKIKPLFAKAMFTSVATATEEGRPHVSPIGSVFLLNKDKGFYFEKFTKSIPKNSKHTPYATLMSVNVSKWFWLKSLLKGQFKSPPAIRLLVKLGELREKSNHEASVFKRKVSLFKRTKGYDLMWKDMSLIREFEIVEYKPVFIGKMTKGQFD